jgi:hypothetical protein
MMYVVNKVVNQSYQPGVGPWGSRLTSRCMFIIIKCLNSTGLNIALLNLMGMAIDHFIAILKPLHYPTIMNKRRVSSMICLLWAISLIAGFSDFLSGFRLYQYNKDYYNYCELIWLTPYNDEYMTFALALVCLVVMLVIYIRIYIKIKHRQRPDQVVQAHNMKRNKKPLVTTLFIVGTFMFCWLPMCFFQVSLIVLVKVNPEALQSMTGILRYADQYLYDLLMFNCIANPIIYAVRTYEVNLI